MSKQVIMGLAKVEYAELQSDGSVGTSWVCYGDTSEGSCTWEQDDAETTEIMAEEVDDPVFVISKKGKARVNYEQTNFDVDALVALCGGTKSEDGDYESPTSLPEIEKALRLTFSTGHVVTFNRVKIAAKLSGAIGRAENTRISVVASILAPVKAGLAPYVITGFKD